MKNIVMCCLLLGTIMVSSHFVMPVRHIEPLKVSCSTSEFLIISCVMHYTEDFVNVLDVTVHSLNRFSLQ